MSGPYSTPWTTPETSLKHVALGIFEMLQPQVLESEDLLGCHLALLNRWKGEIVVQVLGGIVCSIQFMKAKEDHGTRS